MVAYYNEYDKGAVEWLRELINMGAIAPGIVDDRSILDVQPSDLRGFTQHHFFAGIGTWSYSLRNAGWRDDRRVCTASLPCQPFSVAGKQLGKDDERHLLPHFMQLVHECQFDTIFGEQVESAIRHGWLDDLQTNMEREGYAVGATVLGAHSVNAAHQRQRLYWVAGRLANTDSVGQPTRPEVRGVIFEPHENGEGFNKSGRSSEALAVGVAHSDVTGLEGHGGLGNVDDAQRRTESLRQPTEGRLHIGAGDSECEGLEGAAGKGVQGREPRLTRTSKTNARLSAIRPGDSNIEWLYCKDGKYRPIKSGISPLVNGAARGMVPSRDQFDPNNSGFARKRRLFGYGNAINADVAQVFIEAYMSAQRELFTTTPQQGE